MSYQLDPATVTWIVLFIAHVILAAIGGFLGFVMSEYNRHAPGEVVVIRWGRAWFEALAAGFAGVVLYFTCLGMGFSETVTASLVGVFGWAGGAVTLHLLRKRATGMLNFNDIQHKERAGYGSDR